MKKWKWILMLIAALVAAAIAFLSDNPPPVDESQPVDVMEIVTETHNGQ